MVNFTLVATFYVNPVTGNDNNAGSRLVPYKTITRALKACKTAMIVQLAPGVYSTASGEIFPLLIPKEVTVVGNEATKGQDIIIFGSGEYESESFGVQNITLRLLDNAAVRGVTVTNCSLKGTGIWIESTASPTLANNTFTRCGREGVFVSGNAKPVIVDNVFMENGASGLVMARHSQGEILRNIVQQNAIGVAISDFAAPLVANNQLSENQIAIAVSRQARPVLRHNLIEKNSQTGLLVNGNAIPDLGSTQQPAGNIFRNNQGCDIQNATPYQLVAAGNQLHSANVKGLVELDAIPKADSHLVRFSTGFVDGNDHWARVFVEALLGQALISMFAENRFLPQAPVTRAQYAALVVAAFNPTPKFSVSEFIDVPKEFWAYDAIQKAAEGGFVSGKRDCTFCPQQKVQRLQVIVSLVNGLALPKASTDILLYFKDCNHIPHHARTAVATATAQRIIVNYPDPQKLEPWREATRSEVVAMVYQALAAIGRSPRINSPYIVSPFANSSE
jgi:parallel beta-helix repeat protein